MNRLPSTSIETTPAAQRRNRTPMQTKTATAARIIFIVLALVAFAYVARPVVLPVLLAWVAAMTLKPPVHWLHAHHLPTPLAAAIVLGMFLIIMGCGAAYLGRPAVEWVKSAPETVLQLKQKFRHILQPFFRLSAVASSAGNIDTTEDATKKAQPVEIKNNHVASTVFTWTGSLLAGIAETMALLFLLLASGDFFTRKLASVMSTAHDKEQTAEICREIQQNISKYLFSVGLVNIGFGIAVGLALSLTGMPNALMWGGVVALANFIPYFGPVIGMVAVGLSGLLAYDTFGRGLLPAGTYLALHLIEANLVTPFVLGRRFTMNPVVIFITLIFFIWLWGVMGAFLAVPLLVTLKVVCEHVRALSSLGEFFSG